MKYVPVAGTHAKKDKQAWNRPEALFAKYVQKEGWEWCGRPFGFWSTALAGTFFSGGGHLAWRFGAAQLRDYLNELPYEDRNVIAHSWGGAVVAYMLADPKTEMVRSVVTVDTPIQRSLDDLWEAGSLNRSYHEHLYSKGWGSRIRYAAQRGRFTNKMSWATVNTNIKGGHSGILNKKKHMKQILPVLDRLEADFGDIGL